jgi:short chain dehydrogenase
MARAGAMPFVEEGARVFIQARRQEALDDAVKLSGRNVTAVQGDDAELDDLDRLYDTVKREKGSIDVLWASAGMGEPAILGKITEERSNRAFWLKQAAFIILSDQGGAASATHGCSTARGHADSGHDLDTLAHATVDADLLLRLIGSCWRPAGGRSTGTWRRYSATAPRSLTRPTSQRLHLSPEDLCLRWLTLGQLNHPAAPARRYLRGACHDGTAQQRSGC